MTLIQERTSVTLENNTSKTIDLTVPEGKIWKLWAINVFNGDDVTRNITAYIFDSAGNRLHAIGGANVSASNYVEILSYAPTSPAKNMIAYPILIKGGNKLRIVFYAGGTSSGGTGYYSLSYEEVPE